MSVTPARPEIPTHPPIDIHDEPQGSRPADVTPFARRPPRRHGDPAQPDGHENTNDPDLPLPLIPPGLNEGFGLW